MCNRRFGFAEYGKYKKYLQLIKTAQAGGNNKIHGKLILFGISVSSYVGGNLTLDHVTQLLNLPSL